MLNKYELSIEEYKNGSSIKKISKKYKLSPTILRNKLILDGIEIRGKSSTKKILDTKTTNEIIKEYNQGCSIRSISKKFNVTRENISLLLKINKSEIRFRKISLNENKFESIDNEEKAYWLGFLYADGSIYEAKNRLEIGLKISDESHLVKLKNFLETDKEVEYHTRKCKISTNPDKELKCCILHLTSKKLVSDLIKAGCVQKKSLILTFPSENIVPINLQRHFIRGYFDGDGCINVDNTKTHNLLFQLTGTKNMLEYIKKIFEIKANVRQVGNIYDLRCKGNVKALSIFDCLYKDSHIYLERKHDIYEQFKCRLNSKLQKN